MNKIEIVLVTLVLAVVMFALGMLSGAAIVEHQIKKVPCSSEPGL